MIAKTFVRLIIGVLVGVLLGAGGVAFAVWKTARVTDNTKSDAIVVLGAAQYQGHPSDVFKWRLQHALELWRAGYAPTIVTVGGNRAGDLYTEAGVGKKWLVEAGGVPADKVIAIESGTNTLTSAQALKPVFAERNWTDAIVVTDPTHILRSKVMIADQGITPYGSPTRSGPAVWTRRAQFENIVRETGGLLYYAFIGDSSETGSSSQ